MNLAQTLRLAYDDVKRYTAKEQMNGKSLRGQTISVRTVDETTDHVDLFQDEDPSTKVSWPHCEVHKN